MKDGVQAIKIVISLPTKKTMRERTMQISRGDVIKVFLDVLNYHISRESADKWAYSVMLAFEKKTLTFIPPSEQERIWDSVMYLYGIDLQEKPGHYTYSHDDIRLAMLKNFDD